MIPSEGGEKVMMMTFNDKQRVQEALADLLKSEAWRILRLKIEGDIQTVLSHITNCTNPNELLRYSGQLSALRLFLAWPEFQMTALANQMAKEKK